MNPRRVHALMVANFPSVELATLEWVNMQEADGSIRGSVLGALIDEFICADDILVEIHRKLGDFKPRDQVLTYVREHVGKSQIRMADPDFKGYVLIGMNGVAAGWSSSKPLVE